MEFNSYEDAFRNIEVIRLDAVTLKQLRALVAVAETGSLTGAALQLGLTPPAIHSQIKHLEIAFGQPLLQRGAAAGLPLTAEGAEVLEAARRIDVALSQAGARIAALAEGRAGRVTLGVVSTAKYFAPRLVRRLTDLCPGIRIVLKVGNREQIMAGLDRQALDLAIMGRPPRVPLVEAEGLGPHPHALVAPPDHPLMGAAVPDVAAILSQVFLAREEGSGTRILMSRYLDRLGEGQVVEMIEMESNETIKQAAIAGLGIAFLSLHTVMDELQAGRLALLPAPGLPIERQWFLVHPAAVPLGAAAARLREEILRMEGSFLPRWP